MNEADVRFAELSEKPWLKGRFNEIKREVETMLIPEEVKLLYWLTNVYYRGSGAIVDAGCFLGGSTSAFGRGLVDAGKAGIIDSFDMFLATEGVEKTFSRGRFKAGDSILPVFRDNIAPVADHVRVHEGDITKEPWRGGAIEILFFDCGKVPVVNDFVLREMFTCLVPGESVLIQQDYLHAWLPWLHVSTEALDDHFVRLADTVQNSVVYGCVKKITREDADKASWGNLSWDQRISLMDRAEARWELPQREWVTRAKDYLHKLRDKDVLAKA